MSKQYNTSEEIASYGIGIQMGGQLLSNPFEGMDFDAVVELSLIHI